MENPNSKRDVLDWLFTYFNKTLLVFKLYYLFYFAAFGSLFPLISVYFKQLGLSATQCGILVGSRPFVEFISVPIWGIVAERWKKGKLLVIISILSGLAFTIGVGLTKPRFEGCLFKTENGTKIAEPSEFGNQHELLVNDKKILYPKLLGQSPIRLSDKKVLSELNTYTKNLVIPVYSPLVYHEENIYQTFVVLLILLIFGEIMSAPALSLADNACMAYLRDDRENYGRQRMYSSVGWGLAMFFVGIALDNAVNFPNHPCGQPGEREKNYITCFAIFSVFMCFTLITATQMTFTYDEQGDNMYLKVAKDKISEKILGASTKNRQQLVNDDEDNQARSRMDDEILERQLSIKLDKPNYKQKNPEDFEDDLQMNKFDFTSWVDALRAFKSIRMGTLLFLAWFMGFGVGIVFTFLFWHLQDIRGTPTLFGIASVINHISEIIAYFLSGNLINTIGYTKVLYLALLGNIARFLYVSWMTNPWWILPFEMLQGLTHAAVWSACFSYMSQSTPRELRNSAHLILQGVHHGIGKGCGAIFGGLIIGSFGSPNLFRAYGMTCCLVLIGFLLVNYLIPEGATVDSSGTDASNTATAGATKPSNETGDIASVVTEYYSGYNQSADSNTYVEDSMYMSPHGIPYIPPNDYRPAESYNAMKVTTDKSGYRQY